MAALPLPQPPALSPQPLVTWRCRGRTLDLSRRALVMGIVNVTPDSFSDGGRFPGSEAAVAHALALLGDGADLVDIGGESTRPGAAAVAAEEEIRRVIPVIAGIRQAAPDALISVDTSKAAVAEVALAVGADIINDITAIRGDPRMANVVRTAGAGLVLMHMQGTPADMQRAPHYEDVVAEVAAFLRERCEFAIAAGISPECLALDPGIGFGKSRAHNFSLLAATVHLAAAVPGRPLLLGASRKTFLGGAIEDRLPGTVAITALGRVAGARIFRVHEAKENGDALRLVEEMVAASGS